MGVKKKGILVNSFILILGFIFIFLGVNYFAYSVFNITGMVIAEQSSEGYNELFGVGFLSAGIYAMFIFQRRRKGQAAMEFLMTYGWAILGAIIVIGVLVYLGIFSPSTPEFILTSTNFYAESFQLGVSEGVSELAIELRNTGAKTATISSISIENLPEGSSCESSSLSKSLASGEIFVFAIPCTGLSENDKIKGEIVIVYTNAGSALQQQTKGNIVAVVNDVAPVGGSQGGDSWEEIRSGDPAQVPAEWGSPVWLNMNTDGWEDGAFITRDGETLIYSYYPGDLITALSLGTTGENNINIYDSASPFDESNIVYGNMLNPPNYFSEDLFSEGGVMNDSYSNAWYHSNRHYDEIGGYDDNDLYLNELRMAFNIEGTDFQNPHYCEVLDQLWFEYVENDIYFLDNAGGSGFAGTPTKAPSPLNSDGKKSIQPFLTPDCQTIYFSSNRGDVSGHDGLIIYRSDYSGGVWSTPVPLVYATYSVGEPTVTDEGRLFFVQIFKNSTDGYNADIFYVEMN
ncbi:MAG: hypothetical protein Q8P57_04345 [Candidatus Pacearchaeota archaeon]|nr:hypothetical protein [Candidatus Pacearchaeota archaeon]